MKSLLQALLLASLCGPAAAEETAAFLKILPGARPMAMGEAYTAVADDLNALNTNPAGLSRLELRQAAFMHAELFAGSRFDFAGYAQPLSGGLAGAGALGVSVSRLTHAPIEGRDSAGRPTGSFGAADTALGLSFARRLGRSGARGGLQVKLIESRLAESAARTAAFDLGVQGPARVAGLPLTLGASVLNLGQGLRHGDVRGDLPLAFSLGAAGRLAGLALLSVEVRHRPNSRESSFSLGTEYSVMPALSLRAGYAAMSPGGTSSTTGPLGGLGLGFGFRIHKASVDYAFSPAGELGNAQRLSFSTRF